MDDLELEYSVTVEIVADKYVRNDNDLKQAFRNSVIANTGLFTVSQSQKLIKYKKTILLTFNSYAEYTLNIEKELLKILRADLFGIGGWEVQAHILRQEWVDKE